LTSGYFCGILLLTMYIDTTNSIGRKPCILLRECFRKDGEIKHVTIANISHCSKEEIVALELALKYKHDLAEIGSVSEILSHYQGLSVGAIMVLDAISQKIGLSDALGFSQAGKLALWQVMARALDQGSRLSATRLAGTHAVCDVLNLKNFNEDDLYENLDWLNKNQTRIENELFQFRYPDQKPELYLYDVTSSYLEGKENELAAFGYNRDKKSGKMQIVIGLLCDSFGEPISVEVFDGNFQDPKTFSSQIQKVVERFGGKSVTFVGDRGMIKSKQMKDLNGIGFHFITAITKSQIEKLLKRGIFQMSLFHNELAEIEDDNGKRYVLRRNPKRAKEVQETRASKRSKLDRAILIWNAYLGEHPKAKMTTGFNVLSQKIKNFKLEKWLSVELSGRILKLKIDLDALAEEEKLDGCYVLTTDLPKEKVTKEFIHSRYKDLAFVERAFRTCKLDFLELRPINVRKGDHTRAHVFVVMLAYRLAKELKISWENLDITVHEGLKLLSQLGAVEVRVRDRPLYQVIPEPLPQIQGLLKAANVTLPKQIRAKGIRVTTRKKTLRLPKTSPRRR